MRVALWILSRLLARPDRDAFLGDLAEEHALRARSGATDNSWWLWSQVTRSVPPLLWAAVRRSRRIALVAAGVAAYALMTVVQSVGHIVLAKVLPPSPIAQMAASLSFTLAVMVLGGYVAGRIRPGAHVVVALVSALSVIDFMVGNAGDVPHWVSLMWLVACPMTALLGGALTRQEVRKAT